MESGEFLCGIKQFSMENSGRYVILLFKSDQFESEDKFEFYYVPDGSCRLL